MRTEYVRHTTGSVLYAKPSPLATSPWSTGVVSATENGSTGEYAIASLDESTQYTVFVRAGGSPASSDIAIAQIGLAGSTSITVLPISSTVESRVVDGKITAFIGETLSVAVNCSVTLTGMSLHVVVEDYLGADVDVITSVSVSGSTATFTLGTPVTDAVNQYRYSIRNTSGNVVISKGVIVVKEAANED